MDGKELTPAAKFWLLAFLWLPVVYLASWTIGHLLQFLIYPLPLVMFLDQIQFAWMVIPKYTVVALVVLGPIGLVPALLCRRFWRSGYRRGARTIWLAMAAVAALLVYWNTFELGVSPDSLGLAVHFLPVWIVAYLAVFCAPIFIAVLLLQRRKTPGTGGDAESSGAG